MTEATGSALLELLRCPRWRAVLQDALRTPAAQGLADFLAAEEAAGHEVLPPRREIFAALEATPPEAVRVVILGQDPYPTPGHAHGLAFSYRGPRALPRSLRNIFAEIETETDRAPSSGSGDLTPWARQGVLLLNAVLTVRAGAAGSHRRRGWEAVTDAILDHLVARDEQVVFVLWGGEARRKRPRLGTRHPVLEAGHPSPLSIRHFRGCGHFAQLRSLLGTRPIDWRLP